MTKYSLVMTTRPCRLAGDISIRPTYSCARALTYLRRITSVLATGLWSSFLTFQQMICLRCRFELSTLIANISSTDRHIENRKNSTVSKKTVPTYFLLSVCQIWTDFNKNCEDCSGRNPSQNSCLECPLHLKYVLALPWEIFNLPQNSACAPLQLRG